MSLVTGTKLWSAPGGRGQNSVTPGSGHWAEGRGNPKNISKKNGTAHQKKKENHGRFKKKTWAAHGRRAHEIKKKNMGVKKKNMGKSPFFFHSILGAHVSAFLRITVAFFLVNRVEHSN